MLTETLTIQDTIQRVGHTIINGEKVVQYACIIPSNEPQNMRITSTKLNADLYKANRAVCRADWAAFEDAAFALQDEYMQKMHS